MGKQIGFWGGFTLFAFMAVATLPLRSAVADSCTDYTYLSDLSNWTGERSAACPGFFPRVKNLNIAGKHIGSGDFDPVQLAMDCCAIDGINLTVDTCEDNIYVVPESIGQGPWGAYGAKYYPKSCDSHPGGYVAGLHIFQESLHGSYNGDGDFQTKWLSMKCCYPDPANVPLETCGGLQEISPADHWSDGSSSGVTKGGGCGPGGFIRTIQFGQIGYGAGDKEDTGLSIGCCTLATPSPSPTSSPPSNPAGCNFNTGGNGRACTQPSDCCTGYTCEIAGDQPFQYSPDCVPGHPNCQVGVNFASGYVSDVDPAIGVKYPQNLSPLSAFIPTSPSGGSKVCVDSTRTRPSGAALTVEKTNPGNFVLPPSVIQAEKYDTSLMTWSTANNQFVCALHDQDPHRARVAGAGSANKGCSCDSTSEPVVMSLSDYSNLTSTAPVMKSASEMLWAQLTEALQLSAEHRKSLAANTRFAYNQFLSSATADNAADCATVTCPSGGKAYFFMTSPDYQIYGAQASANPLYTASTTSCLSSYGDGTFESMSVVCGSSAPSGNALHSCSDDPNLSYYTTQTCGANRSKAASAGCPANTTQVASISTIGWAAADPTVSFYSSAGVQIANTSVSASASTCALPSGTYSCVPSCKQNLLYKNNGCGTTTSGGTNPIYDSSSCSASAKPLYQDGIAPHPNGNDWWFQTSVANGYGYGDPTATSTYGNANAVGAGQTIACAKTCPANAARDMRTGGDKTSCTCNTAGFAFDKTKWACVACPVGAFLSGGVCTCPNGYVSKKVGAANACRPIDPTMPGNASLSEFMDDANGYPGCGVNRIPVKQNFATMSFANSGTPAITDSVTFAKVAFPYATASPTTAPPGEPFTPIYGYADQTHCACVGHAVIAPGLTPESLSTTLSSKSGTAPRYYPDSADTISQRASGGRPSASYGSVAISRDSTKDGRIGTVWKTGTAYCGCPNLNEKITTAPENLSGGQCVSALKEPDSTKIMFATFNPLVDDVTGFTNVMNRSAELGTNSKVISSILLPASQGAPASLNAYARGIWKCKAPYKLDVSSATCQFDAPANMCSDADPASPVSSTVTGTSAAAKFDNAINKKLACCLNTGADAATQKYDCVENTTNSVSKAYKDFNELWASTDPTDAGEQMNAVMLGDKNGKPLTGFFTMDGIRCEGYSEFTSQQLIPGTMSDFAAGASQGAAAGNTQSMSAFVADQSNVIYKPSVNANSVSGSTAYNNMVAKLGSSKSGIPTSTAEKRRCPILVRAALIATCPLNSQSDSSNFRTLTPSQQVGITKPRCAVADSLQIKVRMEQIYSIAGQTKLDTVDTVMDAKNAGAMSVQKIIQNKWGNWCPPGTTKQGSTCVY
jgi:hypothetical protein